MKFEKGIYRIVLLIICATISGCSLITEKFGKDEEQSSNIERVVKAQLVKSELVEAAPLRVRVDATTIVLEGFVESLDESLEAQRITQDLYPGYSVLNAISVR